MPWTYYAWHQSWNFCKHGTKRVVFCMFGRSRWKTCNHWVNCKRRPRLHWARQVASGLWRRSLALDLGRLDCPDARCNLRFSSHFWPSFAGWRRHKSNYQTRADRHIFGRNHELDWHVKVPYCPRCRHRPSGLIQLYASDDGGCSRKLRSCLNPNPGWREAWHCLKVD